MAFAEAIRRSIAPDGGMYMPGDLPKLPRAFFNNMGEMSLREIAYVVAATFRRRSRPFGPEEDCRRGFRF